MKKIAIVLMLLAAGSASAQQSNPNAVNGGIYQATPPTLTDKQRGVFQLDSNGNLKVTPSGTPSGTQDINIKQIQGAVPSATNPLWVAPRAVTSTLAKITIAITNTYQQALAAAASRTGCTVQYIAVAGTKGYVFFGTVTPSDTTTSFQLTNGQSLNCAVGGSAVATDAVQVTGTATDIFVVSNQ